MGNLWDTVELPWEARVGLERRAPGWAFPPHGAAALGKGKLPGAGRCHSFLFLGGLRGYASLGLPCPGHGSLAGFLPGNFWI